MIIKGTLKNGFKYEYDDRCLHEWKMLKIVRAMKDPNTPEAFLDFCELVLGEKQTDDLAEYIEAKTGEPALIEDFTEIVEEITNQSDDSVKNS